MTANIDIYEKHAMKVKVWRDACERVAEAEQERDRVRQMLDDCSQELLASCAAPKRIKSIVKRGRRAKANGLDKIDAARINELASMASR